MRPGDILLTSNEDIHKPEVRAGKPYERYVIWIHPDAIQAFHKLGDDLAACFLDASDRRFKLIRPDSGTVTQLKSRLRENHPGPQGHGLRQGDTGLSVPV